MLDLKSASLPASDRTTVLRDPSGRLWIFLAHLEDLTPEDLRRRLPTWTDGFSGER
ncbi:hypothetical protein [Kitasatospora purpeofusca]|uniref:hypothetical protein n=1 Tax=Kitasatospora purpeofusca TaxID=67352 RepID=UPI00386AD66A